MNNIRDLIIKNRSYRRFDYSDKISPELLKKWVELARFSASGKNMQTLKYILCTSEEITQKIFPNVGWAGYISSWKGPIESERPSAYIVVAHDTILAQGYFCDDGIAIQSILLGAVEDGYGGCIIGSYNKSKVARIVDVSEELDILYLIALGKPVEEVVLEDVKNGDIKYWRDENQVHHVPKRSMEEIVVKEI